jgi:hypothetical protein
VSFGMIAIVPMPSSRSALASATMRVMDADMAAHGLRRLPEIAPDSLGRMADFERWAIACEGAHWRRGTFQRAHERNREEIMQNAIEADSVALAPPPPIDSWSRAIAGYAGLAVIASPVICSLLLTS